MILPFKEQFVEPIKKGVKIHTIREDKHGRWQIGRKIHLATGVRTKNYKLFATAVCTNVDIIKIYFAPMAKLPVIIVNDNKLTLEQMIDLAKNDGFNDLIELVEWFEYKDFEGRIIYWKYSNNIYK